MHSSFVTMSVAAFPYSSLTTEGPQLGSPIQKFVSNKIRDHLVTDEIDIISLAASPVLNNYNSFIKKTYDSVSESFAVQVQGLHTLIITLLILDHNMAKGNLEVIWNNNNSRLEEIMIGGHLPNWVFSFSIFNKQQTNGSTAAELFSALGLREDDFEGKDVQNGKYSGWCNWNGGFLVTKNPEDLNKIITCVLYQFIKWEATENCHRVIMKCVKDLNGKDGQSNILIEERIVNIMQRMLYIVARLQKDLVSYDQEDIAVHELLERGWGFENLSSKTMDLFMNTKEILNLSQGIELKKLSNRTNRFLSYIGIVGFSGTIAAIISTTDFSNSILSSPVMRFSIIAILTTAILISFKRLMDHK